MIAIDSHALECDLAETYGIYNYRSLPLSKVATFSCGLRDSSRIKMKLVGANVPLDSQLLAMAVDALSMLWWSKTEDAEKNKNRPKSVYDMLCGYGNEVEKETEGFTTPDGFEKARQEILRKD